jgi:hypothetical protein
MAGTRSKSGLVCSHGSELDTLIPRPKMPKTALPPELRRKMGLEPRFEDKSSDEIWRAGSGVLAPTGSAADGHFLRKGSGAPMSIRASRLAQVSNQVSNRANVSRPRLLENADFVLSNQIQPANSRRRKSINALNEIKNKCVSNQENYK